MPSPQPFCAVLRRAAISLTNHQPSASKVAAMSSSSSTPGCCPPSAWGKLEPDDNYKQQGVVEKVDDLEIYRVGKGDKCIIWNYDIFGFNGGRTRQLCDTLAAKGYTVILPDWYRGGWKDPADGMDGVFAFIKERTKWTESMRPDFENKIRPYAEKHGARTYGTVGNCWGSVPVLRLCADFPDLFAAGVSMHPSHTPIWANLTGDDQEAILKEVKAPQMFMPAGDDPPDVKPGGVAEKVLGDKCKIVEFKEMSHGWTTRGDLSDAKVEPEVRRAMAECANFFQVHIK